MGTTVSPRRALVKNPPDTPEGKRADPDDVRPKLMLSDVRRRDARR
jgi:hypothetical protein